MKSTRSKKAGGVSILVLALIAAACGMTPAPSTSAAPGAGNANESVLSGQDSQSTTAGGQTDAATTSASQSLYPHAIWRHQTDGGVIVVDLSDDADRCATLKARQAANGQVESNNVLILSLQSSDAQNHLTTPTSLGDYPVEPFAWQNSASQRWSTAMRKRPGDAYRQTPASDLAVGGQVTLSALNVASQASISGKVDTAVDQGQTAEKLDFDAVFCDLPNY